MKSLCGMGGKKELGEEQMEQIFYRNPKAILADQLI